jgi:hypothetical protein
MDIPWVLEDLKGSSIGSQLARRISLDLSLTQVQKVPDLIVPLECQYFGDIIKVSSLN